MTNPKLLVSDNVKQSNSVVQISIWWYNPSSSTLAIAIIWCDCQLGLSSFIQLQNKWKILKTMTRMWWGKKKNHDRMLSTQLDTRTTLVLVLVEESCIKDCLVKTVCCSFKLLTNSWQFLFLYSVIKLCCQRSWRNI